MFEFTFTATVVQSKGTSTWYFVALPSDMAEELRKWCGDMRAGWGSIRVRVTIGATTWHTSIFPDTKRGTYLLPVKAAIRRAEGLGDGDQVRVALSV